MKRSQSSVRLLLFSGAVFAVESGLFAVVPPLVPLLVRDVHLSTSQVGLLVPAYPAGALVGTVPAIAAVNARDVRFTAFVGLALLVTATIGFGSQTLVGF